MYNINDIRNKILHGDVLDVLKQIPDKSVNCIVTSPPYFGLRSYGSETNKVWDGDPSCEHEWGDNIRPIKEGNKFCKRCGAWYGQLGLEPSLELYLSHLWQITDKLYRVLRDDGVIYWNMGDSYGGSNSRSSFGGRAGFGTEREGVFNRVGVEGKCLSMVNYRFVLGLVDLEYRKYVYSKIGKEIIHTYEPRYILRNNVVWFKRNHMPSSVKDRFTGSYEPVYLLTKKKNYWFDLDSVREEYKYPEDVIRRMREDKEDGIEPFSKGISGKNWRRGLPSAITEPGGETINKEVGGVTIKTCDEYQEPIFLSGRNPGDVWDICTKPFHGAHFAVFPPALVKRMILTGCPEWVCKVCGKGRERKLKEPVVVESSDVSDMNYKRETVGWTECSCGVEGKKYVPGIVLDPFMGSGTTAVVAKELGRDYIGIEMNPNYIKIAEDRLEKLVDDKFFDIE